MVFLNNMSVFWMANIAVPSMSEFVRSWIQRAQFSQYRLTYADNI